MKKRIDMLLVERGLAESRHKAQALLLAGQVLADEQKVDKPGRLVDEGAVIRILHKLPFASRAGAKLQAALDFFRVPVEGRICADLGSSTGGFTDCLLQNSALAVHAFDVGKGLMAWKLQSDARVIVRDGFNVRNIAADDLPVGVSLVVADLSFISLTKILGPLKEALAGRRLKESSKEFPIDVIVLVKPQFEVGKGEVGKGGIVRDSSKRLDALEKVKEFAEQTGYRVAGSMLSPIAGASGNREFLLHLQVTMDLLSLP